jgi:putative heme transporter
MNEAARRAFYWGLVWLALIVLTLLLWELREVVVLAFLALLVAAAAHGPALLVERRGVPRILSILGVYLGLLVIVALILWIVVPPLVEQLVELVENLPAIARGGEDWLREQLRGLPGDIGEEGMQQVRERIGSVIPEIAALAVVPMVIVGLLVNLVTVVFLSALLLIERDRLRDGLLNYLKPERREKVTDVGRSATEKLGAYVRGQLVMMTAIGIGTGIGMLILGVPFVLPLAFLAFLAEAIPIVGPFISGIPIVLIAFTQDPLTGILMAIWVIGLQQLESFVLAPVIQNKALKLSPVVILLGILAGGTLGGVVGALVAIPVVAVLHVILAEVVLPLRRQSWGAEPSEGSGDS